MSIKSRIISKDVLEAIVVNVRGFYDGYGLIVTQSLKLDIIEVHSIESDFDEIDAIFGFGDTKL